MAADTLSRLRATIAARRAAEPGSSYVASLFDKGGPKIAQKLGEEAVETVIAAIAGDRLGLIGEAADLLFHLLVLLEASDVSFDDVLVELDRREGVSGIAEKAARTAPAPAQSRSADAAPSIAEEHEPILALGREPPKRPVIRKG